jgi:acyl dehydratase
VTLTIDARDLPAHVGRSLGTGRWLALQQHDVDGFAELTGDLQWVHIDVERAGRRPFGSTIVHGYFTLSLLPKASIEIYGVRRRAARGPVRPWRRGRIHHTQHLRAARLEQAGLHG